MWQLLCAKNRHAHAMRQCDRHGIQLGEHLLTICRQPPCCSWWPRARCGHAGTCTSCSGSVHVLCVVVHLAGAPNAWASTKRAQQQGRWISRPAHRCRFRLRAMQCADAGPRACPLRAALMCMCRHGCSEHRASAAAWGLPACGRKVFCGLYRMAIVLL